MGALPALVQSFPRRGGRLALQYAHGALGSRDDDGNSIWTFGGEGDMFI
jgi:hypothetical protein